MYFIWWKGNVSIYLQVYSLYEINPDLYKLIESRLIFNVRFSVKLVAQYRLYQQVHKFDLFNINLLHVLALYGYYQGTMQLEYRDLEYVNVNNTKNVLVISGRVFWI
jgi:hypothetical protein